MSVSKPMKARLQGRASVLPSTLGPSQEQPSCPGRTGTQRLSQGLPELPMAGAPDRRDGFAQMLALLEAQLDRDLAGPALPPPVRPMTLVPPQPARAAPSPRPASAQASRPRSMWAPAAAMGATLAVVGGAVLLIALHWRPTRSMASSVPSRASWTMRSAIFFSSCSTEPASRRETSSPFGV